MTHVNLPGIVGRKSRLMYSGASQYKLVQPLIFLSSVASLEEILFSESQNVDFIFRCSAGFTIGRASRSYEVSLPNPIDELEKEFPEIVKLSEKLKRRERRTKTDEWNLNEIREGSGWDEEDIKEELINLDKDPTEREERYWGLFRKYYDDAKRLKEEGDDVQAAEKLWGAITALVKAYVSGKGVYVAHWSHKKIDEVVANNVEGRLKRKFYDLLTYGHELHEHFYERRLPPEKFELRWDQCVELIEKILKIIKKK